MPAHLPKLIKAVTTKAIGFITMLLYFDRLYFFVKIKPETDA